MSLRRALAELRLEVWTIATDQLWKLYKAGQRRWKEADKDLVLVELEEEANTR